MESGDISTAWGRPGSINSTFVGEMLRFSVSYTSYTKCIIAVLKFLHEFRFFRFGTFKFIDI